MSADFSEALDGFIQNEGSASSNPSFCTGWLLICEYTDGQGHTWIEERRRNDMTAWKRLGILYYVMDTFSHELEDEDD